MTEDYTLVLNYYTKYISRGDKFEDIHTINENNNLKNISEPWRFPLIQPFLESNGQTGVHNKVIFLYSPIEEEKISNIELVGSFGSLFNTIPFNKVLYDGKEVDLYFVSLILPVGRSFYYRLRKNGIFILDPINPQTIEKSNKKSWSFFFTDYYNYSNEFEEWEINILFRLVNQIVPFRTADSQNFINRYYLSLANSEKLSTPIYKLDDSVGEVNYITNILAREERHHLSDYKICVEQIDLVLRQRNPYLESWKVSEELIIELYNEMENDNVGGWDYGKYKSPKYFLSLLRRHTITGAFSHPRYGGNIGGGGWDYLQKRYPILNNNSQVVGNYFNWQLAIEKPLGTNDYYLG